MLNLVSVTIAKVLEHLERFYGEQEAPSPADPYLYLVWLRCAHPASDDRCAKGWRSLRAVVGCEPGAILDAPLAQLTKALAPGAIVPALTDAGADRMLLFAGLSPIAAVPSNCPHVIVRIMRGRQRENYRVPYKEAQQEIQKLPENLAARARAFLLLKRHGQDLCKGAKPKCMHCPIRESCAFNAGQDRGRRRVSTS